MSQFLSIKPVTTCLHFGIELFGFNFNDDFLWKIRILYLRKLSPSITFVTCLCCRNVGECQTFDMFGTYFHFESGEDCGALISICHFRTNVTVTRGEKNIKIRHVRFVKCFCITQSDGKFCKIITNSPTFSFVWMIIRTWILRLELYIFFRLTCRNREKGARTFWRAQTARSHADSYAVPERRGSDFLKSLDCTSSCKVTRSSKEKGA